MSDTELADFEPKTPGPLLLSLLFFVYVVLFGAATYFVGREQLLGAPGWLDYLGLVAVAVVCVVVAPFFIAFKFYESKRFRFFADGVRAVTLNGRRSMAWQDVRSATLERTSGEGGFEYSLRLVDESGRTLTIPLSAYRKAESLLTAITARLQVAVGAQEGVTSTDLRDE
jgi:hypothetical protein